MITYLKNNNYIFQNNKATNLNNNNYIFHLSDNITTDKISLYLLS